jgi:hypothetical protein
MAGHVTEDDLDQIDATRDAIQHLPLQSTTRLP